MRLRQIRWYASPSSWTIIRELVVNWIVSETLSVQVADGGIGFLIFSQFKGMLEKNRERTPRLGACLLQNQVQLQPRTDRRWPRPLIKGERCLSFPLKAGGVGLNLTGADTVILVDLWWNPAVEAQAIGRAHRMGQEQMVEVYRLDYQGDHWRKDPRTQGTKETFGFSKFWMVRVACESDSSRIREILGISEASTWKSRQYAIMKCWKGNRKWKKNDFHWCQMMRSYWPEMPVMDFYDESTFTSNIKGDYRDKNSIWIGLLSMRKKP